MNIVDFLLARIAEDEGVAREGEDDWDIPDGVAYTRVGLGYDASRVHTIDPKRLLAECEAKRRIVVAYIEAERTLEEYAQLGDAGLIEVGCEKFHNGLHAAGCLTGSRNAVMALALPYADHPEYDEAWRP